jgi:hypothetical protein
MNLSYSWLWDTHDVFNIINTTYYQCYESLLPPSKSFIHLILLSTLSQLPLLHTYHTAVTVHHCNHYLDTTSPIILRLLIVWSILCVFYYLSMLSITIIHVLSYVITLILTSTQLYQYDISLPSLILLYSFHVLSFTNNHSMLHSLIINSTIP